MIDWLLNQMPEMLARYEYMHSLLAWLQEWINELKLERPAFPWVLPSPLLIASLERAAQECRAVNILRFLVEVQKQIDELKKVNEQRGNDTLALQALMNLSDNVPRLERRLKNELVKSGVMARLFFIVLLFLLSGIGLFAWTRIAKEWFGR
jgi:hypothetical protein